MTDADRETITEIFTAQYRDMLRIARAVLRSPEDAEDAVQEVMLGLLRTPNVLDSVERLGGWLYTLVRRRCVDIIRRETRRRDAESNLEDLFEGFDETDPST